MAKADEKSSTDTIIDSALYPYPDPLNTFILNAIFENATDIHLNIVEEEMLVIFRVDGIVHEKQRLSRAEGRTLLNQLKAAADLKVSKSFTPQEGQMRWRDDEEQVKNIRVTTVPMGDEECAHLRILSMPEKELEIVIRKRMRFSREREFQFLRGFMTPSAVSNATDTATKAELVCSKQQESHWKLPIE